MDSNKGQVDEVVSPVATARPQSPPSGTGGSAEPTIPKTPLKKPNRPPPGYKLVQRRKEDGTVVTMMRKLTLEELEASGQTTPPPQVTTDPAAQQYKIVTVRDSSGGLVRVKRPIKQGDQPAPGPRTTPAKEENDAAKVSEGDGLDSRSSRATDPAGKKVTTEATQNATASTTAATATTATTVAKDQTIHEEPVDMAKALQDQNEFFRKRRMHRMKGTLLRGLGTVVGSVVGGGHLDLDLDLHHHDHDYEDGGDFEDGDVLDSDQSWSDDDFEDNDFDDNDLHDTHDHDDDTFGHLHLNVAGAAGSIITGLAANAAAAPPPQAPPTVAVAAGLAEAQQRGIGEKGGQQDYKVTVNDLDHIEKKAADKDTERTLRHHWSNFSFYLMASLSIILPLLFLLLSVFIICMNNKPVDSSWKKMQDIIKVGISAWPIAFAAIVAQVFKAYATWKVERGIKLIRLEQLVGSNSFASAVKQPMVLRQLDVLSLLVLLTWCLSPFGSQALQRTYYTGVTTTVTYPEVYYLKQHGVNRVFTPGWANRSITPTEHALDNQITAVEFLSTLIPTQYTGAASENSYFMDVYSNPLITVTHDFDTGQDYDYDYPNGTWEAVALMGLPVALPDSLIPQGSLTQSVNSPFETFQFNATSSYFTFSCDDVISMDYATLMEKFSGYNATWSASKTLIMKFIDSDNSSTINQVLMGSANLDLTVDTGLNYTDWEYSFVKCDFEQVFIESAVFCQRSPPSLNSAHSSDDLWCNAGRLTTVPQATVDANNMRTTLEDFSDDWVQMGSPRNINYQGIGSTLTELYLMSYYSYVDYDAQYVNLTDASLNYEIGFWFAKLFNTWVGVGYCPKCLPLGSINNLTTLSTADMDRYTPLNATRRYTGNQVFQLSMPWVICFIVCTVLLLLAGIISVVVESMTVAPDTLGYVSSVVRNSRYLHVRATSGAMSGPERARKLATTKVMMQDVKASADVGKIALGMKMDNAVRLQADRLYR
ncbi:hypothetical protein BX600DRAFT_510254 [Xylariales sp. PMI_506]|nr:hypothetical protein BX600DRAFT_510254 [Xylariales sp. PMI_506]